MNVGSVLVDGFVGGLWRVERARGRVALEVALLARPSSATKAEILDEGAQLLGLLAPESARRDVRVVTRFR